MMFVYDVTMIMPNGDQVTERACAEDEGYAAREVASKWGFKTWQCEYRFEALGEVVEELAGRPGSDQEHAV